MKGKRLIGVLIVVSIILLVCLALLVVSTKEKTEYNDYSSQQEYYEKGYSDVVKPEVNTGKYHTDKSVNSAIHKLISDNSYKKYEILDEWTDITTNQKMYDILFDDTYFYYIAIGEDDLALIIEGDYDSYIGNVDKVEEGE